MYQECHFGILLASIGQQNNTIVALMVECPSDAKTRKLRRSTVFFLFFFLAGIRGEGKKHNLHIDQIHLRGGGRFAPLS